MTRTDENCFFQHTTQAHRVEDQNEARRIMHVNNNEESGGGKSLVDVNGAGLLPGGSRVSDNSGTRSARAYQWTESPISEKYQIAGASSVLQT